MDPEKKNEDDEPLPGLTVDQAQVLNTRKAQAYHGRLHSDDRQLPLPPHDLLQHPDTTVKPTESKEELMANARLMQQTLAQFDIEVALGDITKGPTITRYELHPAPGREAGENHRAQQQHRRRAQSRAHQHSRAGSRQKLRRRGSAERR